MLYRLRYKPLSVNECWKGKRFKTDEYRKFCTDMGFILPRSVTIPPPPYQVYYRFGFSSSASDWDNPIKPFQDQLAAKYKFNDKLIRRAIVETQIVPKGQEYIEFEITTMI